MADSGGGGPSDYAVMAETRNEARQEEGGGQQGFASLGAALGGGGLATGGPGSSGTQAGQMAYARGQQIGAQTVDALAQARTRITEGAAREASASALAQHPEIAGMDPVKDAGTIEYLRQGILAGQITPDQLQTYAKEKNDEVARTTLGNPNAPQADREAAAARLGYAGELPKATGTAGSFETPLRGPGQNPVTVSPQQSAMNQSLVTERGAQADAANTRAAAAPEGGKLQPGYMWDTDEQGNIKMGADGKPNQVPNPAAGTSAVGRRYSQIVVNSAASMGRDAQNIKQLGYDTSTEAQQIGGTHTGVLNTLTNNLGKTLSSNDAQEYRSAMAGITRMAANIEQAGTGRVNQAFLDKLETLVNTPGNTEQSRLYNLAQLRQIMEAGNDAFQVNPDATPAAKHAYTKALDNMRDAIPWTAADVVNFQRSGGSQTLQSFLAKHGAETPGATEPPARGPTGGSATPAGGGLPTGWTVTVH